MHHKINNVFTDINMVEEKVVNRTFRERFIEPILHPVTCPSWLPKTVKKTVPMTDIYQTEFGIICHPSMLKKVKAAMKGEI